MSSYQYEYEHETLSPQQSTETSAHTRQILVKSNNNYSRQAGFGRSSYETHVPSTYSRPSDPNRMARKMSRRRPHSTSANEGEPPTQRARESQEASNDSNENLILDFLSAEEYEIAMQAERALMERQRQIEADQVMARELANGTPPIIGHEPAQNSFPQNILSRSAGILNNSDSAQSTNNPVNSSSINTNVIASSSRPAPPNVSTTLYGNGFQFLSHIVGAQPTAFWSSFGLGTSSETPTISSAVTTRPEAPQPPATSSTAKVILATKALLYDGSPCSICFEDVPNDPVACKFCRKCIGCTGCLAKWTKAGQGEACRQCPLCRFNWKSSRPKTVKMIISTAIQAASVNSPTPNPARKTPVRKRQPKKKVKIEPTEEVVESVPPAMSTRARRRPNPQSAEN